MNPWEDGFYLTCVPMQSYDAGVLIDSSTIWFDHKEVEPSTFLDKIELIQRFVDSCDVVIGHFLKHDMNILRYMGVNFEGKKLWCTMVAEYLIHGQSNTVGYSMEAMAERYGIPGKINEVAIMWGDGVPTHAIPMSLLGEYAQQDVTTTWMFYRNQVEKVRELRLERVVELQNEFIFSLSDMELNGFVFDSQKAMEIHQEYSLKYKEIEKKVLSIIGEPRLNLSSSKQLAAALFGGKAKIKYKEWVMKTYKSKPETKYWEKEFTEEVELPAIWQGKPEFETDADDGSYSTAKNVLVQLSCSTPQQKELKNLLLELSQIDKVKETLCGKKSNAGLVRKVRMDGRIHPSFNQCVTKTGRLSSSDPNGQNLPREGTSPIKGCIIPRYDYIFQWDLSQIEWRAAAWLSQDRVMMHEINTGVDQHNAACVDLMKLPLTKENRHDAKIFNFRMIYGGSPYGFNKDYRMPSFSLKRWKDIVNGFCSKYSGLTDWQDDNIRNAQRSGVLVIPTGRRFTFSKIRLGDGSWGYNERQFKNYPVQGISGGDIQPLCIAILRRAFVARGAVTKTILTVHDSVVFDAPKSEILWLSKLCTAIAAKLPEYISNYFNVGWNVQLAGECEYGVDYGHMKKCTPESLVEEGFV